MQLAELTPKTRFLGWNLGLALSDLVGPGSVFLVAAMALLGFAPNDRAPKANEPPPDVAIVLAGDVMLAGNLPPWCRDKAVKLDYDVLFEYVAPHLHGADIALCNLESPISGHGARVEKMYAFNAVPEAAQGLRDAGFNIVSLANNHCLDYGPEALADTLANLARSGIQYAGLSTSKAPQVPAIVERQGVRIAFLAYVGPQAYPPEFYAFPTRPPSANKETLTADIVRIRDSVDIIVVSIHWGIEYVATPTAEQKSLGRAAIDAGAHIVAGHHPHILQPPEFYKDGLIIYSMGNFVFAHYVRPEAEPTRLYRVHVDKTGIRCAEYLPLRIVPGKWQPTPQSDVYVSLTPPVLSRNSTGL